VDFPVSDCDKERGIVNESSQSLHPVNIDKFPG